MLEVLSVPRPKSRRRKQFRIVWLRSSKLLTIVVAVLILCTCAAAGAMFWARTSIAQKTEALRTEAAALERSNSELEDKIGNIGSVQSIEEIAEEELGLVDPDTVLITPQQ